MSPLGALRTPEATSDSVSGKLRNASAIASDFRRRGDHMVTTSLSRSDPERISSTPKRTYWVEYGRTSFLYWDIELEP